MTIRQLCHVWWKSFQFREMFLILFNSSLFSSDWERGWFNSLFFSQDFLLFVLPTIPLSTIVHLQLANGLNDI